MKNACKKPCIMFLNQMAVLSKQKELAGYFCNSNALLLPALLESFSATYLEAMYFGLPILTSNLDFVIGCFQNRSVRFPFIYPLSAQSSSGSGGPRR